MMRQRFVTEEYDQDGVLIGGGKALSLDEMNSAARSQIIKDRTKQREDAFRESQTLKDFYDKYSTISST